MRSSTINNNFTAGELTPLMYGRTELEPYAKGLAECVNARVMRYGGATRREGTKFVGTAKNTDKTARLIPFEFSQNDSMVIEAGDLYMRFWGEAGLFTSSSNIITNGSFDSGITGWTVVNPTVNWDSLNQRMQLQGSALNAAIARQSVTVLNATSYTFNFTPAGGGPFNVRVGSTAGGSDYVDSVIGTGGVKSFTFTTTSTNLFVEFESRGNSLYVDDVELLESNVLEIVTPYLESELKELMYAQSNDVMYFTHRNHPPYKLSRIAKSPLNVTFTQVDIKEGPFAFAFDNTLNMTLGSGGAWDRGVIGTLTASAAYFEATDQGRYAIIYDADDLSSFVVVKLTFFTSNTVMSAQFLSDVPVGLQNTAQDGWAMQAIGTRNGYPSAVTFHDQRLIYGGTDSQPQTFWGSTVADFDTFSVGTDDDDHFDYELASTKRNDINFLAVRYDLVIGTLSNEWRAHGGGLEDPITPSNVVTRAYTSEGSKRIMPEEANDILCFVQRSGHKLIGLVYAQDTNSVETIDMSLLAEHLTSTSSICQLSYKSERERIIWLVTDEGQLLGVTYDGSQDILAWHQHTTGASGMFESVATVHRVDTDRTWVIVKRTIDGSDVRCVEYIEDKDWREDLDPYYVDCGITYIGPETDTITGLDHLEGETVEAYGGGENLGEYVVLSGSITLSKPRSQVHIGLGYVSRIKELPEKQNSQDGSGQSRQKRKAKVDLRLYKTQGIRVNGDIRQLPRDASASKPELYDGFIETTNLGWDKDAQNVIESVGPNPLTVLAIRSTLVSGNQ